eukprot:246902_1
MRMIHLLLISSWSIAIVRGASIPIVEGLPKPLKHDDYGTVLHPQSVVTIVGLKHQNDGNLQDIVSELNGGFGIIGYDKDGQYKRETRHRMEYVVRALDSDIICWMRSKYVRPVGQVFIHDFTSLNMTRDELDGYRHEFVKFGFQEGSRRGNMLYFPSSDPLTLMLSQNRDNKGRFIAPDDLSSTLAKCNEFMRKWDTSNHTQIIEFLTFARFICPPQVMATAHYDDEYVWRILAVLYDEMT